MMEFSIIYSVDCPRDVSVTRFNPPKNQKRHWQLTEDDSQYDYGYLEGRWSKGKHRKWCAILDREQFEDFLNWTGLMAEDVQTMGSLGAPGCGFGWSPAFSFRSDADDAIQNAYVTPLATRSEIVQFIQQVNEDYEGDDLPIPAILTDSTEQGYLFDEVPQSEGEIVERSIRDAFCAVWG
jgi:hypothetical protein